LSEKLFMQVAALLGLLPFFVLVAALFWWRRPLIVAAPLMLITTTILFMTVWAEPISALSVAAFQASFVALQILLIIIGAVLFIKYLGHSGRLDATKAHITRVSGDARIHAILIGTIFIGFIEGMAGFGTPLAVVAPLLVTLGFPAISAIVTALVGVGMWVAFGAVGTPIRVGLAGLPADGAVFTQSATFTAGLVGLLVGTFLPLLVVWTFLRVSGKSSYFRDIVPYALLAGVCMSVPYFLASFIGIEFPSLLGPIIALACMVPLTKKGFLVPKRILRFSGKKILTTKESLFQTLIPYALFIVFLFLGKFLFPQTVTIALASGAQASFAAFNPGYALVLTTAIVALLDRARLTTTGLAVRDTLHVIPRPITIIFATSMTVQLFILSANNSVGLPGMLAFVTSVLTTAALPFIAPFIGALGGFMTGSATVSNLLFGPVQASAAQGLGIQAGTVLGLQTVGGGTGNTVSLTDITTVQATVGEHGRESLLIRSVLPAVLLYLSAAGLVGLAIIYVF